ncbi:MAG: DUF3298 domain-containing protein [Lachnospiraceae bacterium]|nr:DUF3298 domain-containing protein [Lachnospiraceae bacterium]
MNILDDSVEEIIELLKEEYEKPQMSQKQLGELRAKMKEADRMNNKERRNAKFIRLAVAAAVLIGIFMILPNTSAAVANAMEQIPVIGQFVKVVTFRDYEYETDRNMADIKVPEIKPNIQTEDGQVEDGQTNNSDVLENLEHTTEEINAEIQEITDKLIAEFEANLEYEEGYQDVIVTSEVLSTTADYFTLKLICYQGAGSGYEWNYYYTIDLNTGERLKLKDLFKEGADYITPISENIKKQMQEQMDKDENVYYWLNDEIVDWNFKSITDETSFYLNEKDNVVIGFNEGEVAPMYMGTVEFEIPADVLSDIRK